MTNPTPIPLPLLELDEIVELSKKSEEVVVNLQKRGIAQIPRDINVSLLLDASYSMIEHYRPNGAVLQVLQRMLSISNTIDDDGLLELVLFSTGAVHTRTLNVGEYNHLPEYIAEDQRKIVMANTNFTPGLQLLLNLLSEDVTEEVRTIKKPSLVGRFFGKQDEVIVEHKVVGQALNNKQLIILITDGDSAHNDRKPFMDLLTTLQEDPNVFVQCINVRQVESIYLQNLAESFPHVGYASLRDFTKTDDELIEAILSTKVLAKFGVE